MRENLRLIAVGLSLLIVAGCSETSTSPRAPQARSLSASGPAFDFSNGGAYSYGSMNTSFTVGPSGGSFSVNGLFSVNFPANSVCDPDLSSYGPSEWDKSCVVLQRPITISTATQLTSGGLAIDFQPALRFSPSQVVTISTDLFAPLIRANRDFFAKNPNTLRPLALYYSPVLGGTRVADYITDPSLVTHIDLNTGRVWRRVKHFSGYNWATGQPCDPSPDDPDCIEVDGRDQ